MALRRRDMPFLWRSLPPSLALLIASITLMTLPSVSAQTTATTTPTETTSPPPSTLATSFTSSVVSSLVSGSAAASSSSLLATSTPRPPAIDNAPQTFPSDSDDPNDDGDDDDDDRRGGLINYYFVFLAIFIVLAFLGVYFLNRRRAARKAAWATNGQNALRRDVDAWENSNARRWTMHRRGGGVGSREVEGLNEVGEAPPPYAPAGGKGGEVRVGEVAIPMNTLARDERDRQRELVKPPEYGDAMRADSTIGAHSPRDGSSTQHHGEGSGR